MMASAEELEFSLVGLEEDLTCSICLSTFICPVTIPCGHNFCRDCLLATWKDSYSCPQCRTLFATKPELKKNTVLSTVVETFRIRTNKSQSVVLVEESQPEVEEEKTKGVIRCDTCMEAEAAQTCLTCMASFCEEHLRPHLENPTFRLHQLSQPGADFSERVCAEHHKLMEHFCCAHSRLICSLCLQQVHRGCSFSAPEEQRSRKQTEFREKLGLLDGKIERTDSVVLQMVELQSQLKDAAEKKKMCLGEIYQQMRELLEQDERVAQQEVNCELEAAQTKLQDFMMRFTKNGERMKTAREKVNALMSQDQTPAFLQASFELPKVVKFDPHVPRINLDSKQVAAVQSFAAAMQESLIQILSRPFEDRATLLHKPEVDTKTAASGAKEEPAAPENVTHRPQSSTPKQSRQSRSKSRGRPPVQPFIQPMNFPFYIHSRPVLNPQQFRPGQSQGFYVPSPLFTGHKTTQSNGPPSAQGGHKPDAKGPDSAPKGNSAGHNPHPKKNK
ncbi:E3 ubiquitin/ISG15 ligase TRIM25-like [Nematolebias whitei]|uniref:E3 ubiquitin/ISG15 ligase TRIM25-like n=1 Tax=Nematolebias whitei TaxID=451745 RepID=UPI00189A76DC|nr:E3 ubiquitin/ISG15 ligase TRIM25-like [Nematolebias whitei]